MVPCPVRSAAAAAPRLLGGGILRRPAPRRDRRRRTSACSSAASGTWRGRKMRKVVPLPGVGIRIDEAAGLLDDAVDGREAEAGALADLLGREERLEDLVDDLGRDAGAGVGHLDQHIVGRRACPCSCIRAASAASTLAVRTLSLPPFGMASRALTARLTMTCSNWEMSAFTGHRSRPCMTSSVTFSPISRRSSMRQVVRAARRDRAPAGASVCLRENASRCRTRLAARLAFCLICMMSWNDGSVGLCALSRKSVAIMMADSTLLKSCAMPPASWPTDLHLLRAG